MVVIRTDERIDIPDLSIPDLHLSKLTDARKNIVAYVDAETGRSMTFGEWFQRSADLAAALADKSSPWGGLSRGGCLGIVSPNHLDWPTAYMGTLWTGATVSGANPQYTQFELVHQFRTSEITVVLCAVACLEPVLVACKEVGIPRECVVLFDGPAPPPPGYETIEGLVKRGRGLPNVPTPGFRGDESDRNFAIFPYSSGTTGLPKCVELSHRNVIANTIQLSTIEKDSFREGTDSIIGILPCFHMFGAMMYLNVAPYCGITTVIVPKFDLELVCKTIQKYKITFATLVPPIVLLFAKSPLVDNYDLSSLRWISSGAAPLSADIERQILARLGVKIRQTWGATEQTCSATFMRAWEPIVQGSVGRPVPGMECKIVDPETERELGYDEEGELWMRGPNVMKGYHSNPEATKASLTPDGFYRTGDIGKVDANGIIWITDRLKELIKYKGLQVAPAELEAVLLSHDKIADCAVIGIPDEMAGELPKAWVVLKQPGSMSTQEIATFVEGRVAQHKRLRGGVELVAEIPKSPSGKILRRVIRTAEADKEKLKAKL
ncbi:putative phenylacetyl-CoA ligase [Hyaloraphidium curvatum]|nr:putative phenylacetyl-CoA ligase [Hyaloraphidium curvatum]